MAQDFVTVAWTSDPNLDFEKLDAILADHIDSADGKRIVILGQVPADLLSAVATKEGGKVKRPYAVHAVRGTDGAFRTWLVSSRDMARTLKKAYLADGGQATIQDTRKGA